MAIIKMASATQSRNNPNVQLPPPPPQSMLESVLTSYDHSNSSSNNSNNNNMNPSVSQQQDGGDHADYQDRERSLTLGSEFDLAYVMGKDGRGMSISGLLGEAEEFDHATSVATESTAPSSSSDHNHATNVEPRDRSYSSISFGNAFLPRLPENNTSANIMQPVDDDPISKEPEAIPSSLSGRARGDSTASQFLNGIYNHQPQHELLQQQQHLGGGARDQSQMIAHTPPTQMGTSYENSHFGKRMRSGSISGRLRSASDLEDTGVISREQKAILKDLIIAGDNSVQGAIDKYEAGDPSVLEEMVRSGALLARSSDVDLLGDLDLDFLNVHGEEDGDMMFGNMDDIGGNSGSDDAMGGGDRQQPRSQGGIDDLEFNGDFSNTSVIEPKRVEGGNLYMNKARGNSIDDIQLHRMRANSLALPGLLLEGSHPEDADHISFGRWTDKDVAGPLPPPPSKRHLMPPQQRGAAVTAAQYQQYNASNMLDPAQYSSECDVLMASKHGGLGPSSSKATKKNKKAKPKKEKNKKVPTAKKEKKDKKEPRERKSQSKMRDMMESISSNKNSAAPSVSSSTAVAGGDNGEEDEGPKEVPSGLGRPRSMSDPNLSVNLDDHGLLNVTGPQGWVGAYSPDSRQMRIDRFLEKRNKRVWVKKVKYDVRKNFADSRLRVKGRFVKKEDEMLMRELMSLT